MKNLINKIQKRQCRCAVIGLGYVGLPLAVELGKCGFEVVGIDIDKEKVKSINQGISYIQDVAQDELSKLVKERKLSATDAFSALMTVDTISICVPTPMRKSREPDISYIIEASKHIARHLKQGQLIILESTTYPGTTEEVLLPMFEANGLKVGKDFFLAFSPERVDPGNPQFNTKNIPKVIGGITEKCSEVAKAFYGTCLPNIISVSNAKTAETVKLMENTFRAVNIALANEMALICHRMNIDVWEVINAAKTKPFGFMAFYPGPGIGGHCIPIDPFYLSWKSRLNGYDARLIELAGEINRAMPDYVVSKIQDALNENGKSLKNAKVLVLGVAYKKDVGDVRESPALSVIELLERKGAKVSYNDPFVPELHIDGINLKNHKLTQANIGQFDCITITTDHSDYDYKMITANAQVIVDTRNAISSELCSKKVIKI